MPSFKSGLRRLIQKRSSSSIRSSLRPYQIGDDRALTTSLADGMGFVLSIISLGTRRLLMELFVDTSPEKLYMQTRSAPFSFERAVPGDAASLAVLHTAVAEGLTRSHGHGPWSSHTSEKGVLYAMRTSQVFVARQGTEIVATLRLATKKPWAIDAKYFSPSSCPLYLLAMAVDPVKQRRGIGRFCLQEALRIAKDWPADAIRLDAYDAKAGGGGFYAACGWSERGRVSYRGAPLIYYEFVLK